MANNAEEESFIKKISKIFLLFFNEIPEGGGVICGTNPDFVLSNLWDEEEVYTLIVQNIFRRQTFSPCLVAINSPSSRKPSIQ